MLYHQSDNSVSDVYHTVRFSNYRVRMHFHRGYELLHVMRGQVELTVDGRQELLTEGSFAMILSNQTHRIQTRGESFIWICGFSTDFLPDFDKAVRNKVGTVSGFRCSFDIYSFLQKNILLGEANIEIKPDPYQMRGALYLLCGDYLRTTQLVERDNEQYKLMNDICTYIDQYYQQELTLAQVAKALGYDYNYFSRLFHRVFGVHFTQYLNECRCSAAVEALRDTEKSIAAIALDSGFQSVRTFNSVFLKHMGMSPAQYRKQLKPLQ